MTEAATDKWTASILRAAIRDLAAKGKPFSTDDLDQYVLPEHKPCQRGAAIRAAAVAGLIEATGLVQQSTRPSAHGRLVRIWRAAA